MRDWRGAAVAGMLLRLAAILAAPDGLRHWPRHDPDHYGRFAECLRTTGVYGRDAATPAPSAYRPPLYPTLLAPLLPLGWPAVALLHMLSGGATVWATARIAGTVWREARAGTLAAWLVALDPLLLGQSALLMTETVFVALTAWWLAEWFSAKPWRAGLLLGLAALCRPTAWPLALAVCVWRPHAACRTLLLAGMVALPWAVRNQLALGKFTPTTTHGGYTLYLGMNPWFYHWEVAGGAVWKAEDSEFVLQVQSLCAGKTEAAGDAALRRTAWRWIGDHPGAASDTMRHHVVCLWSPFLKTGHDAVRRAFGTWTATVYLLAALGAWRLATSRPPSPAHHPNPPPEAGGGRTIRALLGLLVALTAVHAVLWSNIRMRAPAIPVLAVLAAGALANVRRPRIDPANPT